MGARGTELPVTLAPALRSRCRAQPHGPLARPQGQRAVRQLTATGRQSGRWGDGHTPCRMHSACSAAAPAAAGAWRPPPASRTHPRAPSFRMALNAAGSSSPQSSERCGEEDRAAAAVPAATAHRSAASAVARSAAKAARSCLLRSSSSAESADMRPAAQVGGVGSRARGTVRRRSEGWRAEAAAARGWAPTWHEQL